MLFRAIALSIALLVGVGTLVPLATDHAEAGPRKSKRYRKSKKYKKYSKRWWRQYHARMKRKKALQARRRAMRLRQLRMAKAAGVSRKKTQEKAEVKKVESTTALLPTGQLAPDGWKRGESTGAEVRFRLENGSGMEVGSASISVVGPAMGESVTTGRNRMLGGVPTTALRREVINRMIRENGWVVNDYQKEVAGKSVYVVVAQSQGANGRVDSRMFYFTEADGRIYSVATNTPVDTADRLAEESEKVLASLAARPRPVQQAAKNEE
jgi:hypothetical protein